MASVLSELLGREIEHQKLSEEVVKKFWLSTGMSDEYADFMVKLDVGISAGSEEMIYSSPKNVIGKTGLVTFLTNNKHVWEVVAPVK